MLKLFKMSQIWKPYPPSEFSGSVEEELHLICLTCSQISCIYPPSQVDQSENGSWTCTVMHAWIPFSHLTQFGEIRKYTVGMRHMQHGVQPMDTIPPLNSLTEDGVEGNTRDGSAHEIFILPSRAQSSKSMKHMNA